MSMFARAGTTLPVLALAWTEMPTFVSGAHQNQSDAVLGASMPTKNSYRVEMEIAGPAAMWTRPDTGSAAISYPGPTFSAAKGIFEAIARVKSAYIRPIR